jgi:hypothetical protein
MTFRHGHLRGASGQHIGEFRHEGFLAERVHGGFLGISGGRLYVGSQQE